MAGSVRGRTAASAGRPRRSTPPGPFLGRVHEMRQLDGCFRAAVDGRGSLVVVSGVAGVGKSRLCEEAADHARSLGLRAVAVRCWAEGGAPALWPWQPIMTELCGPGAAELLAADAGRRAVDPDRFSRFVACTEQLRRASRDDAACLVIDDIHAADAGTLLLTRFVARSLARLRLVLVLARRPDPPAAPAVQGLLDDLEWEADPVLALQGFDLEETEAFLAAHGAGVYDAEASRALHRLSGGNPLHLRRIAVLRGSDPVRDEPHGLRAAIDAALDRLRPGALRILGTCTVLGQVPALHEAAAIAGVDVPVLRAALDEAVAAGLAEVGSLDRFSFAHDLVRAALEERVPAAQQLDAHAAAGALFGGALFGGDGRSPDDQVRAAHHLRRAAPRSGDDADRAVDACRVAARSLVGNLAYEQADDMLTAAVELQRWATTGPPSGALLVEWAEAALHCGRLAEARRRFDEAAAAADHDGDPLALADAALGMGGFWIAEQRAPVERARVLGLQRTALAALDARPPGDEVARRCRLRARLCVEAVYEGAPIEPMLEAVDEARRCGDPRARAEAISLLHQCLLTPEHAHDRVDLADELIRVASEAGLGVLSLMGLCWRAADLFLLGRAEATRALAELRERADTLASRSVLYLAEAMDVMLLTRAGRFDDAEAAAGTCYELGVEAGDANALGYLGAHLLAIRWMQGRDAEVVEVAEHVAASPTLVPFEFGFRAAVAALAARHGRFERAQAALDLLAVDGLAALPRSSSWLTGIVAVVEAAAALDDGKVLGQAYDLLLPHADVPVMPSLAVTCFGSAHRALGVAARGLGDVHLAVEHFEQAVAANKRLGHRPMTAICQADLAQVLMERGMADDSARADALWEAALPAATAMGLTGRLEEWDEWLQRQRHGGGAPAGRAAAEGVIHREGPGWIVGVGDRLVPVPDLVGMHHLAELLTHPGQPLPALSLAAGGVAPSEPSRQHLLDGAAKAAYLLRARELAERLDEAEARHDRASVASLQAELDALVDHVEAATGIAGRPRAFRSPAELARTAVRKAIKRAIDRIGAAEPVLADHLRAHVSTGYTCLYTADARRPIRWSTTARGGLPQPAGPGT